MKLFTVFFIFFISFNSNSQETKHVLFIGNSYTYYNDLPNLLAQAANSAGDVVIHDSNTPPNVSWLNHVSDILTEVKIMQGNWDYVVLQEAGRKAGRSDQYVEENVYPYANELNNLVEEYNLCGETLFYLTWGEQNGVPSECPIWPPFCTYEAMDDLIRERHLIMAENYEAEVSPVGAVWRFLRDNNSGIDLYDPDGYHPSLAGSYAGAITFYTSIFKKDPTLVSFNSTLSPSEANTIREAVRFVVYENLSNWYIGQHEPISNFDITNNGNLEYAFTNTSEYSNDFLWLFGDGTSSIEENPTHTYATEGIYEVSLNANYFCSNSSIKTETISVSLGVNDFSMKKIVEIYPNPVNDVLNLNVLSTNYKELKFDIYNIYGKDLKPLQELINDFNFSINLKTLSSGVYFLKITDGENNKQIIKFIKK